MSVRGAGKRFKSLILLAPQGPDDASAVEARLVERLRAHYLNFPSLAKWLPFEETFEFRLLRFDDGLAEVQQLWRRTPERVVRLLDDHGAPPAITAAMLHLAEDPDAELAATTRVVDFVQYAFLKEVRQRIQTGVAQQIHEALASHPSVQAGNWAVIAHALGTSIVHDALHNMYRKPIAGFKVLNPMRTFMSVVMMVANTSRLLERDIDVYRSMVRPMARVGGGICEWYLNVRHEWDPVAMPKPFKPVMGWPTPDAVDRLRLISVRHFLDADIHSLVHCLEDPAVHVPLFEGMTGSPIAEREAWESRDGFKRRSDGMLFESLRKDLKQLQLGSEDGWDRIIPAWTSFDRITRGSGRTRGDRNRPRPVELAV